MLDRVTQKRKLCERVVSQTEKIFDLTNEESMQLRKRLRQYDKTELQNLYHNFSTFGFEEVLGCVYGCEKMKNDKK